MGKGWKLSCLPLLNLYWLTLQGGGQVQTHQPVRECPLCGLSLWIHDDDDYSLLQPKALFTSEFIQWRALSILTNQAPFTISILHKCNTTSCTKPLQNCQFCLQWSRETFCYCVKKSVLASGNLKFSCKTFHAGAQWSYFGFYINPRPQRLPCGGTIWQLVMVCNKPKESQGLEN